MRNLFLRYPSSLNTIVFCLRPENSSTKWYLGVSVFQLERTFQQQDPHLLLTTAGNWARQIQLAEFAHQLYATPSACTQVIVRRPHDRGRIGLRQEWTAMNMGRGISAGSGHPFQTPRKALSRIKTRVERSTRLSLGYGVICNMLIVMRFT